MLVSFGYTKLPFWPQGKTYKAYFTDAGGISPGNDVNVSGIKVGKVPSVELAGDAAKVTFTVDRDIRVGDQSLVAIKTDTVLGEKSLAVTPQGSGIVDDDSVGPHHNSLHAEHRAAGSRPATPASWTSRSSSRRCRCSPTRCTTPRRSCAARSTGSRPVAQPERPRRGAGKLLAHAQSVTDMLAERAGQVNQLVVDGNQLFAALDERRAGAEQPDLGHRGCVRNRFRASSPTTAGSSGRRWSKLNLVLDNLNERKDHIGEALKRLPPYATALGEVVGSGPGFQINLYGLPPAPLSGCCSTPTSSPASCPTSLADYLRGFISERRLIRPKSP